MPDASPLRLHEDAELFREAVNLTASETGFASRLIEKDYFCTVLLRHLTPSGTDLVFRGGTCLAKVHVGFYRLSEDLDFLISTPVDASRGDRRRRTAMLRDAIAGIDQRLPGLRVVTALTGANDSRQYVAVVGYRSLLGAQEETIKVDVGLREPLMTPMIRGEAHTLLLDPVSGTPMVPVMGVPCVSRTEAMAAKARRAALKLQLEAQLKPVLRDRDFIEFDLERAFTNVSELATLVG